MWTVSCGDHSDNLELTKKHQVEHLKTPGLTQKSQNSIKHQVWLFKKLPDVVG